MSSDGRTTEMSKIKKILIAGSGSIGQRHLTLARKLLPSAEIKILRSNLSGIGQQEVDLKNEFTCVNQAVDFSPCIAIIANAAPHHLRIALTLAKHGTHLLIEKPLSNTTDGVAELLRICEDKNITLACGYNLRYLSSLNYFREKINEQLIGDLYSVRVEVGQRLTEWRKNIDYRATVSARKALGGGVLLELSHEIDYVLWLFGMAEWVSASLTKQSNLQIDVEDTAHLLMGFPHKETSKKLIVNLTMDFARIDKTRTCVVTGSLGTLKWDAIRNEVLLYKSTDTEWETVYSAQAEDTYHLEWVNFLDAIDRKVKPKVTGEDGLRVLVVAEAARLSDETHQRVNINK